MGKSSLSLICPLDSGQQEEDTGLGGKGKASIRGGVTLFFPRVLLGSSPPFPNRFLILRTLMLAKKNTTKVLLARGENQGRS